MDELKNLLELTIDLLLKSKESNWSPLTPDEVIQNLKSQIELIENGNELNIELLKLEFAPTSTIQEISMFNNWCNKYLIIASKIDRILN